MTTEIETLTDAWERRAALTGEIDFTAMYIAHDAFNRDLSRLVTEAEDGDVLSPAAVATWRTMSTQLHNHHTAEDRALWPRLRAAVAAPDEHRILDDMEAEHAALDPRVEQIDAGIADADRDAVSRELKALRAGLSAHMVHEEVEALPLVERRLGQAGWAAFGEEFRNQPDGLAAAAAYVPWVLDGAPEHARQQQLRLLPEPVRSMYHDSWEPAYRGSLRLR